MSAASSSAAAAAAPPAAKKASNKKKATGAAASASAAAPKKLSAQEKLDAIDAERAVLQQQAAAERERDDTESETMSLAARMKKIAIAQEEHILSGDVDFDSGINIEGLAEDKDGDFDVMAAHFTALDEKYTKLAVEHWKLRIAYNQKHREVSEYISAPLLGKIPLRKYTHSLCSLLFLLLYSSRLQWDRLRMLNRSSRRRQLLLKSRSKKRRRMPIPPSRAAVRQAYATASSADVMMLGRDVVPNAAARI